MLKICFISSKIDALKNAKFARFFETIKWAGCRLKMQIKRAVVT